MAMKPVKAEESANVIGGVGVRHMLESQAGVAWDSLTGHQKRDLQQAKPKGQALRDALKAFKASQGIVEEA